jgi:acyl-CoA hydrolase
MIFRTRKLIKPEDLNPRGTLFGGQLLKWIDEEAAIYCMCQLDSKNIVTKIMSEVDFISSARLGDVIEIGCELVTFGVTSITIKCVVRNKDTQHMITVIDKIVFVAVDEYGIPTPHNKQK